MGNITSASIPQMFLRYSVYMCTKFGTFRFIKCTIVVVCRLTIAGLYTKMDISTTQCNAYRSAISSVHEKVDGLPVGQYPLVTRLVTRGVQYKTSTIPRYSSVGRTNSAKLSRKNGES